MRVWMIWCFMCGVGRLCVMLLRLGWLDIRMLIGLMVIIVLILLVGCWGGCLWRRRVLGRLLRGRMLFVCVGLVLGRCGRFVALVIRLRCLGLFLLIKAYGLVGWMRFRGGVVWVVYLLLGCGRMRSVFMIGFGGLGRWV